MATPRLSRMPKSLKQQFLSELTRRYPGLRKRNASQSLFEVPEISLRLYVRYSKLHPHDRTFFGLRRTDLDWLEGCHSLICFLWDGQTIPLLVPYSAFEDVFSSVPAAADGQYKVQVYPGAGSTQLYIANAGRFEVDGYLGWNELNTPVASSTEQAASELSHSQVQTLLGAIGFAKGNDVWLPMNNRGSLDWTTARKFPLHSRLPNKYEAVQTILSEVDVVWIERGGGNLVALFEIEHSTSIYSGLLRFNDVHLTAPNLRSRFSIVARDVRRSSYARQINRPTFQRSGLFDICSFMRYENVFDWYQRMNRE